MERETQLYRRYLAFFEEYDALICPAASVPPFPHEQLFVEEINGEAMPTYMTIDLPAEFLVEAHGMVDLVESVLLAKTRRRFAGGSGGMVIAAFRMSRRGK